MSRGMITEAIQVKAQETLGRDITQEELRLVPYVQYLLCNSGKLDPNRINQKEREIWSAWRTAGYVTGGAAERLRCVSKPFWDLMCLILWESYIDK